MSYRVRLRAVPNAKKSEVIGLHGDAIRVKIAAPALDGRANETLIAFLAEKLGLAKRDVRLVSGDKSRDKLVEVDQLTEEECRRKLLEQ